MRNRRFIGVVAAAAAVVALGACSSSKSSGDSGSSGGSTSAGGRGPITVVQGKDNSNVLPTLADMWNKDHPNEKVTFKQQSDSADDQLQDLQQHFQSKDAGYDVVAVDVVWTAQLAAQGWLVPLKGAYALDTSKLLPATVKAATYVDTLYAAPSTSDGGMLYYRKDLISTPPTTWAELIADCAKKPATVAGCYAGQFANYEGLTVNAAEAINAAGGIFIKSDGKTPDVDTAAAKKGLAFLADGFKQGYIPKDAIGYKETESLNAFEGGNLLFMRNWPYAASILSTDAASKVKDVFGYAPLPGPDGTGASSLGGHSWAISQYSKNKATALDFLKFTLSTPVQSYLLTAASLAPTLSALYTDPTLVAKAPYLPILLKSIETAVPRPVTPYYPAVTKAIETNAYAALQGTKTVDQAISDMQAALKAATNG
ncbi:MAG: transporter substrate-binding protein [Pseudonocardiales bacterium]|nr:transporter substrate-binding protein [Pseudonocardiales bacterium]